MSQEERLIVGLGNPEEDYADTRHNLGFACVRELARRLDVKIDRKRWQSLVGRSEARGVWFVLPQTYMNLSGEAVARALRDTKLTPDQLWVVHDELDLGRLTPQERERCYQAFAPDPNMRLYERGIRRRAQINTERRRDDGQLGTSHRYDKRRMLARRDHVCLRHAKLQPLNIAPQYIRNRRSGRVDRAPVGEAPRCSSNCTEARRAPCDVLRPCGDGL